MIIDKILAYCRNRLVLNSNLKKHMTIHLLRTYKIFMWIVVFCLILFLSLMLWIPSSATAQTEEIILTVTTNKITISQKGTTTSAVVMPAVSSMASTQLQCDYPDADIPTNWGTTLNNYNGDVCAMLLHFGYQNDSWQFICPHQTDIYCPLTF